MRELIVQHNHEVSLRLHAEKYTRKQKQRISTELHVCITVTRFHLKFIDLNSSYVYAVTIFFPYCLTLNNEKYQHLLTT